MAGTNGSGGAARRLKSWKEIAAFFGTDERTVRRWEERGLPVRRVPGGARATIYADVAELERWFSGRREEPTPGPASAAGEPRRRAWIAATAALLLVAGVSAFALSGKDLAAPADAPRHQPPQKAVELYLAGTYHWERRTAESLRRAVSLFGQAIAEDPAYAEAYAGLANAYLLLREYAGMPDADAYPRALEAAQRALELDDGLAQAHAARAFVTFYWERNWRRGLAGFRRAIELEPGSARAHHWYATALYHAREIPRALAAINEAQRRDPQSRSILADKALILFHSGRTEEALAILQPMAASEPEFLSPHAYLAIILHAEGDYPGYLREARAAARIVGDGDQLGMIDEATRAFERGGREAMLRTLLARQRQLHSAGRESAYALAATSSVTGDRQAAINYLQMSAQRREPEFLSMRMDPMFRPLHGDPEFRRLAARLGSAT